MVGIERLLDLHATFDYIVVHFIWSATFYSEQSQDDGYVILCHYSQSLNDTLNWTGGFQSHSSAN